MEHVYNTYMKINRGSEKTFTITRGGRKQILQYDDIVYFETSTNEHKIIIHTENKSIEFFGMMKEIEREVGHDFIRCHRGYLVNKHCIQEVSYLEKTITLKNKVVCPISYRMLQQVKKQLQ
jgi:two-component system response regulator AgrA